MNQKRESRSSDDESHHRDESPEGKEINNCVDSPLAELVIPQEENVIEKMPSPSQGSPIIIVQPSSSPKPLVEDDICRPPPPLTDSQSQPPLPSQPPPPEAEAASQPVIAPSPLPQVEQQQIQPPPPLPSLSLPLPISQPLPPLPVTPPPVPQLRVPPPVVHRMEPQPVAVHGFHTTPAPNPQLLGDPIFQKSMFSELVRGGIRPSVGLIPTSMMNVPPSLFFTPPPPPPPAPTVTAVPTVQVPHPLLNGYGFHPR